MMRVALVSPLFESVPPRFYGGTERVVYNLCRGLTDENIEVTLFASGDSSVEGKMVPVTEEGLRLRKKPSNTPEIYNLRMMSLIARQAREFDVIHNHNDFAMLPLSEMTPVPVVSTLHGRLDLPDLALAYEAFPHSGFVSISNAQRRPLPNLNWLKTVHHGINAEEFTFCERPGKYLAFLGRITPEKKPDWAIQIAKESGVPLKLAAKIEGPESQQYYEQLVKPHVDGKFIEYIGEISENEKSEFLGQALALVFPIDWPEPFGLVMIESLACGTPILARPYGSAPELTCDGVTGYSHLDIHVLARRLASGDVGKLDRRKCRKWVEDKFSLQRMTEDYIHVYRTLTESRSARGHSHRWNLLHSVQRATNRNS